MSRPVLVIRADASPEIGVGHVMRCLALAQAWRVGGGGGCFALASPNPPLEARLRAERMDLGRINAVRGSTNDARETAALALSLGASWVVADGYCFGEEYQATVKQAGVRLMVLDDCLHAKGYLADLILNQNIYATPDLYRDVAPEARLLLGSSYVLLRREYWKWRGWNRPIDNRGRRLVVTLGGGDVDNVSLKVIRALDQVRADGLKTRVLIGANNLHCESLETAARKSRASVELIRNVTDMPAFLSHADLAVSAGGATCWELAFMGIPPVIIVLAENQRRIADALAEQGVATNLGSHEQVGPEQIADAITHLVADPEQARARSRRARDLVDGLGAQRVAEALRRFPEQPA